MSVTASPVERLVKWSPHDDSKFVVSGKELRLYEVHERDVKQHSTTLKKIINTKNKKSVTVVGINDKSSATGETQLTRKVFHMMDSVTVQYASIRCIDWSPEPENKYTLGVGVASGKLAIVRFFEGSNSVVKEFVPKFSRPCNSVKWNTQNQDYVAVGLDRVRDGHGAFVWNIASKGSKVKDFSSTIESLNSFNANDVRKFDSVVQPMSALANSEAGVALSWLPNDASSLAVGTGHKWLRIYDVRGNFRPLSIFAHPKGVYGVRFDPMSPSRLATFSEDNLIKLWDIRMIQRRNAPLMTLSVGEKRRVRGLLDIFWCPTRPGYLSAIAHESDEVLLWDLSGAVPSEENPTEFKSGANMLPPPPRKHRSDASLPISSLSWHPHHKQRMLTITTTGIVEDVSLHESIPVDFTCHNSLAFATLSNFYHCEQPTTDPLPPQAGPDGKDVLREDIAVTMKRKALEGYRLNSAFNKEMHKKDGIRSLAEVWSWIVHLEAIWKPTKLRVARSQNQPPGRNSPGRTKRAVKQPLPTLPVAQQDEKKTSLNRTIYSGVQEVILTSVLPSVSSLELQASDSTVSTNAQDPVATSVIEKPRTNRQRAQALKLSVANNTSSLSLSDFVETFDSPERSEALKLCQWWNIRDLWSGKNSVDKVNFENSIRNLEERGMFEKACCVALFHLDLHRSLRSLQHGMTALALKNKRDVKDPNRPVDIVSKERHAVFGLVALALSGYATVLRENGSREIWKETCRLSLSEKLTNPYLRSAIVFLNTLGDSPTTSVLTPEKKKLDSRNTRKNAGGANVSLYRTILFDGKLDMSVRTAFALSFLNDTDLKVFMGNIIAACSRSGVTDGLLLTGLNTKEAVNILQAHVNQTADIQTVALLSCYALAANTDSHDEHMKQLDRWISIYRQLLNRWGMFTQRAQFDIARAELSAVTITKMGGDPKSATLRVRPQVVARCTFCGGSLALNSLGISDKGRSFYAGKNTKALKTRVRGCPRCKKSLPRCSICLVSMDCAVPKPSIRRYHNPNADKNGLQEAKSDSGKPQTTVATKDDLNFDTTQSLFDTSSRHEFSNWFTWCQRCRHGGHSNHISSWFQDHVVCPVTDCNCPCTSLDI